MRCFEDIGSKGHFSAKKGFCWDQTKFFSKIRLEHFLRVNIPLGDQIFLGGQNNIKNEFSTIKLLKMQISAKSNHF